MKKHVAAIILAGSLWGTTGLFRRVLDSLNLSTMSVVFIRSFIALICFTVTIFCTDKKQFKIKIKDFWCFLGTGLIAFLLFTICYFKAMMMMSLSTACILLYTAPCFVILISIPCFKEKISLPKIIALVIALTGCALVSGIGSEKNALSLPGILIGLASGLCYALYSIFSRFALNRGYSPLTINFWTSLLAVLGSLALGGWQAFPTVVISWKGASTALATGFVTCFLPYMFYTYGLTGVENGKASIIASIEPVVATLCGILVFKEKPTLQSLMGILLVLGAIVLLNLKFTKTEEMVSASKNENQEGD